MNNDGIYKREELSAFNTYLNNNSYFILSLKFRPRVIIPVNGDVKYHCVWMETEETHKELEIWNKKIELFRDKIENNIPIYTFEMEEEDLLDLIEMDKKCNFYMLGDRKGNQIQIIDLQYVSLEDIYKKIEEVKIYLYFIETIILDE